MLELFGRQDCGKQGGRIFCRYGPIYLQMNRKGLSMHQMNCWKCGGSSLSRRNKPAYRSNVRIALQQ